MINIVCLKWGTKYGPEYVNRLYGMCRKFYTKSFTFYCATDNANQIRPEVQILDLEKFKVSDGKWGGKVFTAEKINLLNYFETKTLLLDLDILVLNNIEDWINNVELNDKPYFIRASWANQNNIKKYYGAITCDINSSFVIGNKQTTNKLKTLLFSKNYDYYALKYRSLDKTLFYNFQKDINFYEGKQLVYSFNDGASWPEDMEPSIYRPDYKICIFNNSHGAGVDLHDCNTSWATKYWESFDD